LGAEPASLRANAGAGWRIMHQPVFMSLKGLFMYQFRLAHIGLMLAAVGLNAVPALQCAAHAQHLSPALPPTDHPGDHPAARDSMSQEIRDEIESKLEVRTYKYVSKKKPPSGPVGTPVTTIREEMAALFDSAKIGASLNEKKFAEVEQAISAAEALPDKTAYESFIINRVKIWLGASSRNEAMTTAALEAALATDYLSAAERSDFLLALGDRYYVARDYPKAVEILTLYQKGSSTPEKVRPMLIRASYLSGDFARARTELAAQLAEEEKAGKTPANEDLRLLASAGLKLEDTATYVAVLEKIALHYSNDKVWTDLLDRVEDNPGFSPRLRLDLYRLTSTAMPTRNAEDYANLAGMALSAGFFAEAKKTLDAGFAAGLLGTAAHKALRQRANKGAADDAKKIAGGEASAAKAKDGIALVSLGYAYVTMDQFDKGIEFMKQGIAKGVTRPDDARLHLGVALAKAGRRDEALQAFATAKGNDGLSDLAKYWSLWLKGPMKSAPAPATAAR
jgi:hypothetical protein